MPGPVERWLETFMCKHYADIFEAFGFKTLQSVCQLQLQQLQTMGVAPEHCELILENVFVLRQTLLAGNTKSISEPAYNSSVNLASSALRSVAMNSNYQRGSTHNYQEDYQQYGPNGSQIATSMGYQKHYNDNRIGSGMSEVNQRGYRHGSSYTEQNQMMMQQQQHHHQQQQMTSQANMFQQPVPNQSYLTHNQQYGNPQQYPGSYISRNPTASNVSSSYYNTTNQTASAQQPQQHPAQQPQQHPAQQPQQQQHPAQQPQQQQHTAQQSQQQHPGRQTQTSINPQAVADNILQMASSFPSSQTVQVPLNKNRHAPYHVPQTSHNYNLQNTPSQNPMNQHRMYSNMMNTGQPTRTSPISPMPQQSPVSHHSNQSIASPVSMHSSSPVGLRSPAQSPGGGMRSPCGMQPMASPLGQPMRSPSQGQMGYSQTINSPQRTSNMKSPVYPHHYSPNRVGQVSSPYNPVNRTVHSPQGNFSQTMSSGSYITELSQEVNPFPKTSDPSNPLQSLQKLVMLPETRVVDPKSVVNDACVPSPQNIDSSKNCDSSAEWLNRDCSCSAGSTNHSSPDENRPISTCTDDKNCYSCDDVDKPTVACHNDKKPSCDVQTTRIQYLTESDANPVLEEKFNINDKNCSLINSEDKGIVNDSTVEICSDIIKKNTIPNGFSGDSLKSTETESKKLSPPKKKILTAYNESLQDNSELKTVTQLETNMGIVNGIGCEHSEDISKEIPVLSNDSANNTNEIHSSTGPDKEDSNLESKNHITIKKSSKTKLTLKSRDLSPPMLRSVASENNSEDSEEELHVRKDNAVTYSRVRIVTSSSYNSVEKMREQSDGDSDDEDYSFNAEEIGVGESEESSEVHSEVEENYLLEEEFQDEDDLNDLRQKLDSFTCPTDISSSKPESHPVITEISDQSPSDVASLNNDDVNKSEELSPSRRSKRNPRNTPPLLKREETQNNQDHINTTSQIIEVQKRKRNSDESCNVKKLKKVIEVIVSSDEDDEKPLKCVIKLEGDSIPSTSTPTNKTYKIEETSDMSFQNNLSVILKSEDSLCTSNTVFKKRPYRKRNQANKSKSDIKVEKKKKSISNNKESLKNLNLGRTLSHMRNIKRKTEQLQNTSPFVRLVGSKSEPSSVVVYNNHPQDEDDSKQKKAKGPVSSSLQISNLPSDKSIMVPHSQTLNESTWVCALCGKRSSYKFLGDLFGPYYLDSHVSLVKRQLEEESKKDKAKAAPERKRRKSSNERHSLDSCENKPNEVWVHENCTLWSDGVFLIGSRIYGLEEAVRVAAISMCSLCKESGAMIGCLHKGCNQKYHFMCAAESKCFLDEDNFSLLCVKHKDKRRKTLEVSTGKT